MFVSNIQEKLYVVLTEAFLPSTNSSRITMASPKGIPSSAESSIADISGFDGNTVSLV